jgi:hypothetical protein
VIPICRPLGPIACAACGDTALAFRPRIASAEPTIGEVGGLYRFLLDDEGPREDLLAMGDITHPKSHQVTTAPLAVERTVEEGQLTGPARHL